VSEDRPKGVDFADIVRQGEPRTRPLYIHASIRGFFHSVLRLLLAKHIIPEGDPFGVDTAVNRWAVFWKWCCGRRLPYIFLMGFPIVQYPFSQL
jgi:hypothetical protein